MASIYDQHDAAFRQVSAYVVMKGAERVATIAFKFGARVTVYIHWIGLEMARGIAGGGGYDRKTAACADAVRKIKGGDAPRGVQLNADEFVAALAKDGGHHWDDELRDAGFQVWQAV